MRAFVGVTDQDWFNTLRNRPELEEVNFWQPSGSTRFRAIDPGELFLFKLHSPLNFIVGGGFYAHFTFLPISLAWEAFGAGNGANSLVEVRERVAKYRKEDPNRQDDYTVGCILLQQPFFLPESEWIPIPQDWAPFIVRGKTYDLTGGLGAQLWRELQEKMERVPAAATLQRYGDPVVVHPRLGQGTFRVVVTDAYERKCAFTSERTLPALEAAHIKPYAQEGDHNVSNGLLMRRDLHALFDRGYVTVTPAGHVEVSRKIKEEFENGREYYKLHGNLIRTPADQAQKPSSLLLQWHNEEVYLG